MTSCLKSMALSDECRFWLSLSRIASFELGILGCSFFSNQSSEVIAEGASRQAGAMEETASAMEEMGTMTKRNAGTAQETAKSSDETREAATDGVQAMSKMTEAINEIDNVTQRNASEAEESASASRELSGLSDQVRSSVFELLVLVDSTAQQ